MDESIAGQEQCSAGARPRGRLGLSVVDQILASAAIYLPVLFVARVTTPGEFGIFLIAYGALAMLLAISRAMFGVVVGMDLKAHQDQEYSGLTVGGVIVCAVSSATLLFVAAAFVPFGGSLVALLGVGALMAMPHDLARCTAVAQGFPTRALVADALWVLPCLIALVLDVLGVVTMSASGSMALWLGALAVSLAVFLRTGSLARPRFHGLWGWWRRDARRRHLGSDSVLSGLTPVANGWGAALVAGTTAVAAARGAAMIFAPIAVLMLAMTISAVPEALRRTQTGAVGLLNRLTALLVTSALAWGGLVLVIPDALGRQLLGDSWTVARPVLPIVCLEYAGLALWAGGATMLRFASATGTVLRWRLAYAPAAALLPVLALATSDDPRHFAGALAALAWIVGCATLLSGRRAVRK